METVEIDKIHVNDRSFCVSYPLEDDLLLTSVAKFGVLVPIGLLRRDEPVIVTGFKRLEAARRLGIRELPYVFLDVSERRALLTAIHDNITRPLNTVEKALCIDKMLTAGFKVRGSLRNHDNAWSSTAGEYPENCHCGRLRGGACKIVYREAPAPPDSGRAAFLVRT